jgi:hypothetical protein
MHKKVIIYVVCALIIAQIFVYEISKDANAQYIEEWVARYDAANDGDYSNAIIIGSSGNIYVTGHSYIGEYSDYATVAYDSLGNTLWTARYNGPDNSNDASYDIIVDASENIYVTGTSSVNNLNPNDESYLDYATIAYDQNGNELWIARYNGPGNGRDKANAMAIDPNGHIIITGDSLGSDTGTDYTTIAYDLLGNQIWVARYNGPGNDIDEPWAITFDDITGNIFVTGRSVGIDGIYDYATVAYDSNGNELWTARYNGPGNSVDEAWAIATDSLGNVYVTGNSESGSESQTDMATIAYDNHGNQLWVVRSNTTGPNSDGALDIAVDNSGNVYVTGTTQHNMDPLRHDYLTIAYNTNGNMIWEARYNGPSDHFDSAKAIAVNSYGHIFVTGKSKGPTYDYATIAYDSDGNELWVARYDGPGNSSDSVNDLAIDLSGNPYVTGYSGGLGTGRDFATIKYSRSIKQPIIDIDPDTLNLKSKGRWITCYIDIPDYDVNNIDISTILLEDTIPAEWGDVQGTTLMVKFDRSEVEDYIGVPQDAVELWVTGEFYDGTEFEGSDTIRVICPP